MAWRRASSSCQYSNVTSLDSPGGSCRSRLQQDRSHSLSHYTCQRLQVPRDFDTINSLSFLTVFLTVTLHVSTYKCYTTVTESTRCHFSLTLSRYTCQRTCAHVHVSTYTCQRTRVNVHVSTYMCQRTRVNIYVSHDCDRVHSLSFLTVILHMSTYVSQDCGRVHSLLIFTVTLQVSTYKSHTTVTESTHYIHSPS